eukprot:CAMPEP_0179716540 /NCGR_PEP_ID=MMETSP0938-20121108/1918_1 /TAXON_ID=548131 ORGANISM="Ostreococcus mediterraneus, Strain clade-D-RCC1107" /NCGR_SAMPLE_ID=MMETSP0938 /ASSEMBLY_ACC=CAM_ASM_000576 /LENGTH=115 /DNA_ID=CAMNT_0021590259 /DNA_START=629 /DNA_END=977 /DNA_ORIENTATION=-
MVSACEELVQAKPRAPLAIARELFHRSLARGRGIQYAYGDVTHVVIGQRRIRAVSRGGAARGLPVARGQRARDSENALKHKREHARDERERGVYDAQATDAEHGEDGGDAAIGHG